jgi:tRNA (mo5U34)-methyltransferase
MASEKSYSILSREEIGKRIAEFDADLGWYQDIDLGNGLHTKSRVVWGEEIDHPRRRWSAIESAVPTDLTGKSVLDIGCNAGFIAFEAARRGATDVLGVDARQGYIDQARFCAEVTGSPARFEVWDVYDLTELGRQFDVVFFVGVLYHCVNIALAVEQVARVTSDLLIVESAAQPGHDALPLVRYVGNDPRRPGTWHPTIKAMIDMFEGAGFPRVEPLFQDGGRGGVVARRSP